MSGVSRQKFVFVSEKYFEDDLRIVTNLCRLELWTAKETNLEISLACLQAKFFLAIRLVFVMLTNAVYLLQNLAEYLRNQWATEKIFEAQSNIRICLNLAHRNFSW